MYTHYESQDYDYTSIPAPDVIRSMVSHPSSQSAATDFLRGAANSGIDFDLIDIDFHKVLMGGQQHAISYVLGARYAGLNQAFDAQFVDNGTETVTTDIDFHGGGIRIGLEGEWYPCCDCGFVIYGRGMASFVGGRFNAHYNQSQTYDPLVVDTEWDAHRVVSILDLELGVGWTSHNGCLRLTAGYLFSGWHDTVMVGDFIEAVQANAFRDLSNTLTFDGLTARTEVRF